MADTNLIIEQAKKVLALRDETGGIPGGIENSSELQVLAILIQHYEAELARKHQLEMMAMDFQIAQAAAEFEVAKEYHAKQA